MKSLLIAIILATMATIAFAGGAPTPDQSTIDCYPTVEPQDLTEKGWKRLKSFNRLTAAQDSASGKITLQRFETLTCVAYHGGEATEFPAAEWWWRRVGK
jgi:hypothetical protein